MTSPTDQSPILKPVRTRQRDGGQQEGGFQAEAMSFSLPTGSDPHSVRARPVRARSPATGPASPHQ